MATTIRAVKTGTIRIRPSQGVAERAVAEGHWIGSHTLTHSVQFGDSDNPDCLCARLATTRN